MLSMYFDKEYTAARLVARVDFKVRLYYVIRTCMSYAAPNDRRCQFFPYYLVISHNLKIIKSRGRSRAVTPLAHGIGIICSTRHVCMIRSSSIYLLP